MKVSIITIVRNGRADIEKTIVSVLEQSYSDIEYIVLDGNSDDGTQDIVERYRSSLAFFKSEPDQGISDAWNKGLGFATGDVVGLLNCADEYYPDTVARALASLEQGADLVYGDTDLTDAQGNVFRTNRGKFSLWRYSAGLGFWHPSVLARRSLYAKIGGFPTDFKYAMDNDWLVRAHVNGAVFRHGDHKVRMQTGGVSVRNRYLAYGEHLLALSRNDVSDPTICLNMIATGLRWGVRSLLDR